MCGAIWWTKKHLELLKLSDIRSTLGTRASIAVPGRYLYSNHVSSYQPGDTRDLTRAFRDEAINLTIWSMPRLGPDLVYGRQAPEIFSF